MLKLGLNFTGFLGSEVSSVPPDTVGAVGPTNIVMACLYRVGLWDKLGKKLSDIGGRAFFHKADGTPSAGDEDNPRVVFNPIAKQFAAIAITEEGVPLQLSASPSPSTLGAADWKQILFPLGGCDFPSLGYNADAYMVSLANPLWTILSYNRLGSGQVYSSQLPVSLQGSDAPAMARMPDSKPGDPMWLAWLVSKDILRIGRLDSCPPYSQCTGEAFDIPITVIQNSACGNARQLNGQPFDPTAGNGDCMVRTVNGKTLLYFCNQCGNAENSCAVFACIVDITSTPTLIVQEVMDGGAIRDYYNGSISANAQGDIGIGYLSSGPHQAIEHQVSVAAGSDGDGGTAATSNVPFNSARMGDYSCTCTDETDGSFWSFNTICNTEVTSGPNWEINAQRFWFEPDGQQVSFKGTMACMVDGVAKVFTMSGSGVLQ